MSEMNKFCYIATIPHVIYSFMSGHINEAAKHWDISIVCNSQDAELLESLPAHLIPLPIQRKIAPWQDLVTLARLILLFRREHFTLVHSIMPKTGLLSMLAAWITRVPYRVHTFTGQVWATQKGLKRLYLKLFDKLIVLFATQVLVDSHSQRQFLIDEGILLHDQGSVIANGSICGVDIARFRPDEQVRKRIRSELSISENQIVILFLGRLNKDKGMLDLAQAFSVVASCRENVCLLLVGAEEDVSYEQIKQICGQQVHKLRRILFTASPQYYMAAADIFCLPSYREGFGQVIIEAAACAIPVVATRIYGITDAVEEDKTGLLFQAGDIDSLTKALMRLIDNAPLRLQMGMLAKDRATALFSSDQVTRELTDLYLQLLAIAR